MSSRDQDLVCRINLLTNSLGDFFCSMLCSITTASVKVLNKLTSEQEREVSPNS